MNLLPQLKPVPTDEPSTATETSTNQWTLYRHWNQYQPMKPLPPLKPILTNETSTATETNTNQWNLYRHWNQYQPMNPVPPLKPLPPWILYRHWRLLSTTCTISCATEPNEPPSLLTVPLFPQVFSSFPSYFSRFILFFTHSLPSHFSHPFRVKKCWAWREDEIRKKSAAYRQETRSGFTLRAAVRSRHGHVIQQNTPPNDLLSDSMCVKVQFERIARKRLP